MAELLSQQHLPCVSNLSWSTNQQQAWTKEVELSMPGHQALSRVNLLLIGCLRGGQSGEWRLMDASGSVSCEVRVVSLLLACCYCCTFYLLSSPVSPVPVSVSSVAELSRLTASLELHPPQCIRGWRPCGGDWFSCFSPFS